MVRSQPHFLLFSGADSARQSTGRWQFLLESMDGHTTIEASDVEPGVEGERLELLAVVRGLEALDQPSRVTLVTTSPRVSRGFRFGLEEWRSNRWRWERDGRWVPIKNRDLWQRVDRALKYHLVNCRTWRLDPADAYGRHTAPASNTSKANHQPNWPELASTANDGDSIASQLAARLAAAVRAFGYWLTTLGGWTESTRLTT